MPIELANTAMAAGEPALPVRFRWRDEEYQVAEVLSKHREFQPEGHKAGNEKYLRKHWVEVVVTAGLHMKLYCERQARSRNTHQRWWLYSIEDA